MVKRRLLNGCARSPFIVEAFECRGWEAWTCDLLPAEGSQKHIRDDVRNHLNDGWDMGIFHPVCTRLALSGVRWIYERSGRLEQVRVDAKLFNDCLNAPIPLIVVENPIQHHFAREYIRPYDQIIQPWQFGDMESKAICLWLKGLPKLVPLIIRKPEGVRQSVWRCAPSEHRATDRARNFRGVSEAMAEQWG